MSDAPLLERLSLHGADVEVALPDETPADAESGGRLDELVAAMRRAVEMREDAANALAAWDEAGSLHDLETLDAALVAVTPGIGVPFLSGMRRRRLRDSARAAFRHTERPGTLCLLAAVLGAVGGRDDVPAIESAAVHPAFTLHAATALANLSHWEGRAALLRLLSQTHGEERVETDVLRADEVTTAGLSGKGREARTLAYRTAPSELSPSGASRPPHPASNR